jgi:subtilisin
LKKVRLKNQPIKIRFWDLHHGTDLTILRLLGYQSFGHTYFSTDQGVSVSHTNSIEEMTMRRLHLVALLLVFLSLQIPSFAQADVPVLIRFDERPGQAQAALVARSGGQIKRQFQLVPAFAATLPAPAIAALRAAPGVAAVELDGTLELHDHATVWGVSRIGAPIVHSGLWVGEGQEPSPILGTGIRVAVLDTGIDYLHLDLAANYRGGYDFVNNDSDPWDDHGHGTHVAGTVAALWNGVGAVGVAPEADLYALKVMNSSGTGSWSAVVAALDWAVQNEMHVVNLSIGSPAHPGTIVKAAFDNAYAAGLVIVSSAGNAGLGENTVGYPARFETVIAVGATTSSDTRSSFSSTGPDLELAAPGSSIYSTTRGGGYGLRSGTSMASPHVAGAAALVLAAGIVDLDGDGRVNDEVRWVLQTTAEDLGLEGRDEHFGFGLVDVAAAVQLTSPQDGGEEPGDDDPPPPPPAPVFEAPSNLTATASARQVTLTWQDNSNVEDCFEVYCGVRIRGNQYSWSRLAYVDADTTTLETTMANGGTYRFRVRAVWGGQTTDWSNDVQLSIQ